MLLSLLYSLLRYFANLGEKSEASCSSELIGIVGDSGPDSSSKSSKLASALSLISSTWESLLGISSEICDPYFSS